MGSVHSQSPWNNLATTVEARSYVYGLLANILRSPIGPRELEKLRSSEVLRLLAEWADTTERLLPDKLDVQALDDLAVDFTQLFHGPRDHIMPYESLCTTRQEDGELEGKAAARVREFMETNGIMVSDDCSVPADHISVELDFMSQLLRQETDAWKGSNSREAQRLQRVQRQFMNAHLGRWAPDFAQRIAERAETTFYRAVATLLGEFIEVEKTLLVSNGAP